MSVSLRAAPITSVLLEYLQWQLGIRELRYIRAPEPNNDGWETFIYRFQLGARPGLPPEFTVPLILRIYASAQGLPRLQHEFAVQEYVAARGYPVARVLLWEEDCSRFGGPFLIMQCVSGETLLEAMLHQPWRIISGPRQMAEAHVRLHHLGCAGFPTAAGPFLERHLQELEHQVQDFDLHSLVPGLRWLMDHQPGAPQDPRIIHLDFHPLNLMVSNRHIKAILDWSDADVGDIHADVAATLVLIRSAPVEVHHLWDRLSLWPGRWLLYRWYLRAMRRREPLDGAKLRYYLAWASFRRLCRYGMWFQAGPTITGSKPSSLRRLTTRHINTLRRCFARETGIGIALGD
jgi:aminoglycoside phosphotransferase (APT) family kinase protein